MFHLNPKVQEDLTLKYIQNLLEVKKKVHINSWSQVDIISGALLEDHLDETKSSQDEYVLLEDYSLRYFQRMFHNIEDDFNNRFPLVLRGDTFTFKDSKIFARFNHAKAEKGDLKDIVLSDNEIICYEELQNWCDQTFFLG